ncbi:MAG: hypothetical protein USCGTAYLOR_02792 [Chromatiales bacterium USCg_Taylor]|nr:MAG: hypothetical protein USCGTAYLOR_02792 [Chromatiales bacterium USCg_Taylor]
MKKRWTAVLLLSLGSAWAEEPFYLSVKDNTLSARITQIPLGEVLQALAREARVAVYVRGSAEAISASFDELPLEEGVKRLLTGRDYTLAFERPAPAGRSPRLIEIRILAEGGAGALTTISEATPAPETIPTSVKLPASHSLDALAREAQQAREPARIAALKALVEQGGTGEQAVAAANSALKDGDPQVRGAALRLAREHGLVVENGTLREIAVKDSSRQLRGQAWVELVERSETIEDERQRLNQAFQDPDPGIKGWAERKLAQIAEEDAEPAE